MSVQFFPPSYNGGDPVAFARALMTSLQEVFFSMEDHMRSGTIVLWPAGKPIPVEYLKCDGITAYQKSVSPALWRLLAVNPTDTTFKTPVVTAPTGSVAVIRV